MNFLTLDGRDSMTCNPFGPASADTIREILVGQLTEPGQPGNGGVFFGRAVGFLGAIAPVLTWMRDEKGVALDLECIRDATELSNVVLLATKRQIKFTDSATGTSELLAHPIQRFEVRSASGAADMVRRCACFSAISVSVVLGVGVGETGRVRG